MELIKLVLPESLITEVSDEVADFAAFLDIPYDIHSEDDHIYIEEASLPLQLTSFSIRRNSDVEVSTKVFCEILMDIVGGLTILEAYNKQDYTY